MKHLIGIQSIGKNIEDYIFYIASEDNKIYKVGYQDFQDYMQKKLINIRKLFNEDIDRHLLRPNMFNVLVRARLIDNKNNTLGYKLLGTNGALATFSTKQIISNKNQLNCLNGMILKNGEISQAFGETWVIETIHSNKDTYTNNLEEIAVSDDFTNWDLKAFEKYMKETGTPYKIENIGKKLVLFLSKGYNGGKLGSTVKIPKIFNTAYIENKNDIDTIIINGITYLKYLTKDYTGNYVKHHLENVIFDKDEEILQNTNIPYCRNVVYPKKLKKIINLDTEQDSNLVFDTNIDTVSGIRYNNPKSNDNKIMIEAENIDYMNHCRFSNIVDCIKCTFKKIDGTLPDINRTAVAKDKFVRHANRTNYNNRYINVKANIAYNIMIDTLPKGCRKIKNCIIDRIDIDNSVYNGIEIDGCLCKEIKIRSYRKQLQFNNVAAETLDLSEMTRLENIFSSFTNCRFDNIILNENTETVYDYILQMNLGVFNTNDYPNIKRIKSTGTKVNLLGLIVGRADIKIDREIFRKGDIKRIYFCNGYNDIARGDINKVFEIYATENEYIKSISKVDVTEASLEEAKIKIYNGASNIEGEHDILKRQLEKTKLFGDKTLTIGDIEIKRAINSLINAISNSKCCSNTEIVDKLLSEKEAVQHVAEIDRDGKSIYFEEHYIDNMALGLITIGTESNIDELLNDKIDLGYSKKTYTNTDLSKVIEINTIEDNDRKLYTYKIYHNGLLKYRGYINEFEPLGNNTEKREYTDRADRVIMADLDNINILGWMQSQNGVYYNRTMHTANNNMMIPKIDGLVTVNSSIGREIIGELDYFWQYLIYLGKIKVDNVLHAAILNLCDGQVYMFKSGGIYHRENKDIYYIVSKLRLDTNNNKINKVIGTLKKENIDIMYFKQMAGIKQFSRKKKGIHGSYYSYRDLPNGISLENYLEYLLAIETKLIKEWKLPKYIEDRHNKGRVTFKKYNQHITIENITNNYCIIHYDYADGTKEVGYRIAHFNLEKYLELVHHIQNMKGNQEEKLIDAYGITTGDGLIFNNIWFDTQTYSILVTNSKKKPLLRFKNFSDLYDFSCKVIETFRIWNMTNADREKLIGYMNSMLDGTLNEQDTQYLIHNKKEFYDTIKVIHSSEADRAIFNQDDLNKIFSIPIDLS